MQTSHHARAVLAVPGLIGALCCWAVGGCATSQGNEPVGTTSASITVSSLSCGSSLSAQQTASASEYPSYASATCANLVMSGGEWAGSIVADRTGDMTISTKGANDFAFMLKWQLPDHQDLDLVQAALDLAHTPVQPLKPLHFPDKMTRRLLGA